MNIRTRSLMAGGLGALFGMQLACAHAPAQEERKPAAYDRVVVTGSRIPVPLDSKTGIPMTTSPVQIYSRDQLLGSGHMTDLRAALLAIDPSVTIGP